MSNTSDNREIKVGYKVLRKWGSQLKSSSAFRIDAVDYGNSWTTPLPGNGPLCVFSSERCACDFMWSLGLCERLGYRIYRCWYVESKEKTFWSEWTSYRLYRQRIENPNHRPRGTIFADAVHLIDEVSTGR